jgi:hypothetical protein
MKLPGAKEVKFEAGKKPGTQKVILVAAKEGITKEEAVKSLGKKANRYVVKAWTDPSAAAEETEKADEAEES